MLFLFLSLPLSSRSSQPWMTPTQVIRIRYFCGNTDLQPRPGDTLRQHRATVDIRTVTGTIYCVSPVSATLACGRDQGPFPAREPGQCHTDETPTANPHFSHRLVHRQTLALDGKALYLVSTNTDKPHMLGFVTLPDQVNNRHNIMPAPSGPAHRKRMKSPGIRRLRLLPAAPAAGRDRTAHEHYILCFNPWTPARIQCAGVHALTHNR